MQNNPDYLLLESLSLDREKKLTEALNTQIKQVSQLYEHYRNSVRNGNLVKTATFWLYHLDLSRMQHVIHTSIQENDFEKRVLGWKYFLPFYFALNYSNYARYGSYYAQVLESIEQMYPGLKDMLKCEGLSVQAQENYSLRTSIDQRGEKTINREAKTSGGVKAFSTKEESVLKWCLNRSEQAKNTIALEDLCGLGIGTGIYKPARPSQILKHEKLVLDVIEVMQGNYINPFEIDVDKAKLFCLSSALPVSEEISEHLLTLHEKGKSQYTEFIKKRLHANGKLFLEPIKRNPKLYSKSLNKKTVSKSKKSVETNRDMLAKLLAICIKQERKIDFQKALTYPLAEALLTLCNADGSMRKTNKSNLSKKSPINVNRGNNTSI